MLDFFLQQKKHILDLKTFLKKKKEIEVKFQLPYYENTMK